MPLRVAKYLHSSVAAKAAWRHISGGNHGRHQRIGVALS